MRVYWEFRTEEHSGLTMLELMAFSVKTQLNKKYISEMNIET